MTDLLITHTEAIADLCRRFGVARLDVFGSAVGDDFDPTNSDIDFLVEFELPARMSRFDAYFGLKESLEALLGYPVDLVERSALRNPYFAAEVERTKQTLYAA